MTRKNQLQGKTNYNEKSMTGKNNDKISNGKRAIIKGKLHKNLEKVQNMACKILEKV